MEDDKITPIILTLMWSSSYYKKLRWLVVFYGLKVEEDKITLIIFT